MEGRIEEPLQSSLVCEEDSSVQNAFTEALKSLNYKVQASSNVEHALKRLQFNKYNIIALDETFGEDTIEKNKVLNYFNIIDMDTRRDIFLVLISYSVQTYDNMAALTNNINLIVNVKDLLELPNLLNMALIDNRQFYKMYKEILSFI